MFIHTFSLRKAFCYKQLEMLWRRYRIIVIEKGDRNLPAPIEIIGFSEMGLRIKIYKRTQDEIRYDKYHRDVWAELIVTPYKLICNGTPMGELTTAEEYDQATNCLGNLLLTIEKETGIGFLDAEIYRIDLTYDVITPSQTYTKEIIAAMKVCPLPYGYIVSIPSDEILEANKWKTENAFLYTNHHQHFGIKLYDKEQNLLDYDKDIQFLKSKGILRFEISLSRKYLKKNKYIVRRNCLYTLLAVLEDADLIYQRYIIEPLDFGDMFSKDILLRYLYHKAGTKEKLFERMLYCVENAWESKKRGVPMENDFMGSIKSTNNILRHFRELDVSPVPLAPECPHIPSVSKMIEGQCSQKKLNFAKKHTNRKEYWDNE